MSGFEGFDGIESVMGCAGPFVMAAYVPPPKEPAVSFPEGAEGWTTDQWRRFADVTTFQQSLERIVGAGSVSWEYASAAHDRAMAEVARELAYRWAVETRRYWSGPSPFDRQTLRAFRVSAAAIGLTPRSAFSGEYRRRQRARVKRRRR